MRLHVFQQPQQVAIVQGPRLMVAATDLPVPVGAQACSLLLHNRPTPRYAAFFPSSAHFSGRLHPAYSQHRQLQRGQIALGSMQTEDCGPRPAKLATPTAGIGLETESKGGQRPESPSTPALGPYSTQQPKGTRYLLHAMLKSQHAAEEQQVGQEARASTLTHNSVPLQGRT